MKHFSSIEPFIVRWFLSALTLAAAQSVPLRSQIPTTDPPRTWKSAEGQTFQCDGGEL
jgi:hypothetical protein